MADAHRENVVRDGVEYTCVTVDAQPSPPPPSAAPDAAAETRPGQRAPLCPAKHAPLPVPTDYAPKGPPPVAPVTDAADALLSAPWCIQGNPTIGTPSGCYWYIAGVKRYADWSGVTQMVGYQSQENPFVAGVGNVATDHSIGQLWAIDDDEQAAPYSTVEVGWRRVSGEPRPRLFVFRFDNGQPRCYVGQNGCNDTGWVPYWGASEVPGQFINFADTFHRYEIQNYGGDWWVGHDGQWLGYYAANSWTRWPNRINRVEFGGEVFEVGGTPNDPPCTDMGNGTWGNWGNAAMFSQTWRGGSWGTAYMTTAGMRRTRTPDNREPYRIGFFNHGNVGDFRYGGPGFC